MTNFSGIIAVFETVGTRLQWPKITLRTASGQTVAISRCGAKHPGCLNVTNGERYGSFNSVWYGRIEPNGEMYSRANLNDPRVNEVRSLLLAFNANPAEVAGAQGRMSGNCVFCQKQLTDPQSVAVGYGPICADHYGLPHGAAEHRATRTEAAVVAEVTATPAKPQVDLGTMRKALHRIVREYRGETGEVIETSTVESLGRVS